MSNGDKASSSAGGSGWMSSLSRWALGRADGAEPADGRTDSGQPPPPPASRRRYTVAVGERRQPPPPSVHAASRLQVLENFVHRFPAGGESSGASMPPPAPRDYDSMLAVAHSGRRSLRLGSIASAGGHADDTDALQKRRLVDAAAEQSAAKRVRVDSRAHSALAFKRPVFDESADDAPSDRPPLPVGVPPHRAASAMCRPASAVHWTNSSMLADRSSPAASMFGGGGRQRQSAMFTGLSTRTQRILEELERASTPLAESRRMPAYKAELGLSNSRHQVAPPPVDSLRTPTRAAAVGVCTPSRIAALPYRFREGSASAAAASRQRSQAGGAESSQRRRAAPVKSAAESGASTRRSNVFSAKFLDDDEYDAADDGVLPLPPAVSLSTAAAPASGFLGDDFTFAFSKPQVVAVEAGDKPDAPPPQPPQPAVDTSTSASGGSSSGNESAVAGNEDECAAPRPIEQTKEKGTEHWQCIKCKLSNDAAVQRCICCKTDRNATAADLPSASGGGDWSCPDCMTRNKAGAGQCPCCGAKEPDAALSSPKGSATGGLRACPVCMVHNAADASACAACTTPLPGVKAKPSAAAAKPWTCGECWVPNDAAAVLCVACSTAKPGAAATAAAGAQAQSTGGFKPTLDLVAAAAAKPPGVSFGLAVASKAPAAPVAVKKQAGKVWRCTVCFSNNAGDLLECSVCQSSAPSGKYAPISFGLPPPVEKKSVHFAEDKLEPAARRDSASAPADPPFIVSTPSFGLAPPVKEPAKAEATVDKPKESAFQFGLAKPAAGAPPPPAFAFAAGSKGPASGAGAAAEKTEAPTEKAPAALGFGLKRKQDGDGATSNGTASVKPAPSAKGDTAAWNAFGLGDKPAAKWLPGGDASVTATVTLPPVPSAALSTAASTATPPAVFAFGGAPAAAAQSTAVPDTTQSAFSLTNATADAAKPAAGTGFGFAFNASAKLGGTTAATLGGGGAKSSGFQFGAAAAGDKAKAADSGGPPEKKAFAFGASAGNAGATDSAAAKPLGSTLFGAAPAATTAGASMFSLAATTATVPKTTTTAMFGTTPALSATTTSAAASSPFALAPPVANANGPLFGAKPVGAFGATLTNGTGVAKAETTGGALFGAPAAATATGATGGFNFAAPPVAQPAAGGAFAFGAPAAQPQPVQQQPGAGFQFAAASPPSFQFGGAAPAPGAMFGAAPSGGLAPPSAAALPASLSSPSLFQAAPQSAAGALAPQRRFARARRTRR